MIKIIETLLSRKGLELTYEVNGETKFVSEDIEGTCALLREAEIIEDYFVFDKNEVEVTFEMEDMRGNFRMTSTDYRNFYDSLELTNEHWTGIAQAAERLTTLTLKEVV